MERIAWIGPESHGKIYDLQYAAKVLGGVSVWTLRKHIAQGRVRVTRIGRRIFIDAEEVERIRREGLPSLRVGSQDSLLNSDVNLKNEETESCR